MMCGFGWCGYGAFGGLGALGWIGAILNLVFTLAVIIALIALIVWAVRRAGAGHGPSGAARPGGQSAREIAEARYARGEISREEFQQILNDLGPSGR